MGKSRRVEEAILYEADMTCCVCRRPEKRVQIHHLDGDSSNGDPANLAVLCLEHHDEASSNSTMSRGLSAGVIARYRDSWRATVRKRCESASARAVPAAKSHEAMMEALACHEVRKFSFDLTHDWDVVSDRLSEIAPFAASWSYGNELRSEVLSALHDVASRARWGMPASVASEVGNLAFHALPIFSLVDKAAVPPDEETEELLQRGVTIGFAVAYDGIKYLGNIAVVAAGTRLLRSVLRYSHLNGLEKTKNRCLAKFGHLLEEANRMGDVNSRIWAEFERDDALALDDSDLPSFPSEVAEEIRKLER